MKERNSEQFANDIAEILKSHKAEDVRIIDLRGKTEVADFFVIASGRSMTHTRSLIDHVEEEVEKSGTSPIREEGVREGRWAVIDYADVIVHVFNDETRLFYHLESLWEDKQ